MKMANGITVENLLRTLPEVLRNDEEMLALGTALATALSARVEEIGRLQLYTRIRQLPEDLLDILAYDFKVDWYGYDDEVQIKGALVENSFYVHRHLGTRGAVETAMSDIYPGMVLEEWWEYGGGPYRFKVHIATPLATEENERRFHQALDMSKNLRSALEAIVVTLESGGTAYAGPAMQEVTVETVVITGEVGEMSPPTIETYGAGVYMESASETHSITA